MMIGPPLVRLWCQVEAKSQAICSRWPWTWGVDDSRFKKFRILKHLLAAETCQVQGEAA
jgi:hypothetical protein